MSEPQPVRILVLQVGNKDKAFSTIYDAFALVRAQLEAEKKAKEEGVPDLVPTDGHRAEGAPTL